MSPNMRGALLMIATMAAFTINDALIKLTDGTVPLFQLIFLRGMLASALVFCLAVYLRALRFGISRRDWGLIAMRSASEMAATYFFLTALFNMPLANVTAVMQVLPLTVTLASALVFGETVGWRRMSAILVGFAGMLLIVRPGPEGFNIYALYTLMAVACVTVRDLSTRRLSPGVSSMTVTLTAAVSVTLFAGIGSLTGDWVPLTMWQIGLIVGAAFFVLGGYVFSVMVMRVGDVSFVAPFRYTGLVWALILGWFWFDHWPTHLTLLGASIVVATGLFTLYRERALLKS
jgi:S-adenosylmethionine uptake transporter